MKFLRSFVVLLAVITANSIYAQNTENVTVVQLSQVEGQYENTNLALTPGKYIFEVTNKNVAKKLGFYLTPTSDAKAQVANSGLSHLVAKGKTARTGVVDLTAGDYQYSCPLNPTPHYSLKVAEKQATTISDVTVVRLSQTEGVYENTSLALAPGKYIFEVKNKNVAKSLGFYLTPTSDAKAQVANSGLSHLVANGGTARTGVVDLTAGDYQYSCPLNPTPKYSLNVSNEHKMMKDKMGAKMKHKMMKDKMGDKMDGKMEDKMMKDKMGDKMEKK